MAETYRRKLIEVALPLEAINRESAREKSIRHGHPSTLHLWWARRPLAACRAVLFASIVDDPSSRPDLFPTEEKQEVERQRLFRIIEELVKWENTTNETVLEAAREEIRKATDGNPPPVLDPFCGGGSIPLEAQRLGLEAHASDLNPVAVLIAKALIEIPPKFAGQPPVNPDSREKLAHGATWNGAQGLADDVRYYGKWIRDEAYKRIGHLYPKANLPDGGEATVIAWLWTRTVICPNPACGVRMPLVRSFDLSTMKGREWHVEPSIADDGVHLQVRPGKSANSGTVDRRGAKCVACGTSVSLTHVRNEGKAGRLSSQMMAIVAEGERKRIYLSPDGEDARYANIPNPQWQPDAQIPLNPRDFKTPNYGLTDFADLFTRRQLVALSTFSDLVGEARQQVVTDAVAADVGGNDESLESGGLGPVAYADAVAVYLGFLVSKLADKGSTLCSWDVGPTSSRTASGRSARVATVRVTFARQALAMTWDFAEVNFFSDSVGSIDTVLGTLTAPLEYLPRDVRSGTVQQLDVSSALNRVARDMIATDPPYYDNIGYADLSDFFYVWLRHTLGTVFPTLFSTLLTPKSQELVATPYRFGGDRREADTFFETGLYKAFSAARASHDSHFPMTFFYAFKQAESQDGAISSTGWDTMLSGLLDGGFAVTGTWPVRSELSSRTIASGKNALASSIVLACRPRPDDAPIATRREFVSALRAELPVAMKQLQHGNIAPVDLAQASIGPGMAVFSRYAKVLEADGTSMNVRSALALINQTLDEILAEQEGDFDADTRFAVTWFEQHGFGEAAFGEVDVLARAKDTSTGGLEDAGVLHSRAGKARLLRRDELPNDWDPVADRRPTVWEATQHLAHRLEVRGEEAAAELLRRLGGLGETARELAYRLYTTCERKGWAQDARAYNALVVAWPEIARLVAGTPEAEAQQVMEL
jgi:putative DNA methylase